MKSRVWYLGAISEDEADRVEYSKMNTVGVDGASCWLRTHYLYFQARESNERETREDGISREHDVRPTAGSSEKQNSRLGHCP